MEVISSPPQTDTAVQLSRLQLMVVAVGYAAVVLLSAALVLARYLQYMNHRADADASSGMWAFGDWMLELFIAGLFLLPTLLLAFFIRNSDAAYTRYSQALLGISLTAPISIAAFFIPAIAQSSSGLFGWLGWLSLGRVSASPVFLIGLVLSWVLARFRRAQRLIVYGLLVEVGTYVFLIGTVLLPWHRN